MSRLNHTHRVLALVFKKCFHLISNIIRTPIKQTKSQSRQIRSNQTRKGTVIVTFTPHTHTHTESQCPLTAPQPTTTPPHPHPTASPATNTSTSNDSKKNPVYNGTWLRSIFSPLAPSSPPRHPRLFPLTILLLLPPHPHPSPPPPPRLPFRRRRRRTPPQLCPLTPLPPTKPSASPTPTACTSQR